MFFSSPEITSFTFKGTTNRHPYSHLHRQELIPGYDQQKLADAHIYVMGVGGIGSEISHKLTRKGVGQLTLCDPDRVDSTNLNRQFFRRKDIGKYKAHATARQLKEIALNPLKVDAFAMGLEDIAVLNRLITPDVIVCGVDDMCSRAFACEYAHKYSIPMVSVAVDYTAETGVVFVQKPGDACFGCFNPELYVRRKAPCFAAASADILSVVNGFALRAIDSLLMPDLHINWNFVEAHVAGFMKTITGTIPPSCDCPVCKKHNSKRDSNS